MKIVHSNIIQIIRIIVTIIFVVSNTLVNAEMRYNIQHHLDHLHIKAQFDIQDTESNKIKLYIPRAVWGTDYSRQIQNITVQNGTYLPKERSALLSPNKDNTILYIEYDILNIPSNEFAQSFCSKYFHFVNSNRFLIFGTGAFISPAHSPYESGNVVLTIDTPLNKLVSNKYGNVNEMTVNTHISDLDELILIGSEDLYQFSDQMSKINIWTLSSDAQLHKKYKDIGHQILLEQQAFWGRKNFPRTILFVPKPPEVSKGLCCAGGIVVSDSIIMFIDDANEFSDTELYNLLRHEALHFWFGQNLVRGPQWFSEGFTDYYRDKILYHFSHDAKQFVDNYNKVLEKYFTSDFHHLSNKEIAHHFFNFLLIEKLPYWKGYLIAGQLDSIIDLDNALKSIFNESIATCTKSTFSYDLLMQHLPNLSEAKKAKILHIMQDFDKQSLNKNLCNRIGRLQYKHQKRNQYNIHPMHIINNEAIAAAIAQENHLPKSCRLRNMSQDTNNNIMLHYQNHDQFTKIALPVVGEEDIKVPYYQAIIAR